MGLQEAINYQEHGGLAYCVCTPKEKQNQVICQNGFAGTRNNTLLNLNCKIYSTTYSKKHHHYIVCLELNVITWHANNVSVIYRCRGRNELAHAASSILMYVHCLHTVCGCSWNTAGLDFSLLVLIWFHVFGQRHFARYNSVLQRHQNSSSRTFGGGGASESSATSKRWSKRFHLSNVCSNLNDLTGTSSLWQRKAITKRLWFTVLAEMRRLYQVQRHTILLIQAYSSESASAAAT